MRSAKSHGNFLKAGGGGSSSSSSSNSVSSPTSKNNKDPLAPSRWSLLNPKAALNPSRQLLGRLLHNVQLQLQEDLEDVQLERGTEIDVVFSGGGLRGYYCCGASVLLDTLVDQYDLKVCRLAGASAGAWCAVFVACGIHPLDWADTYYESSSRRDSMLLDAYRAFIPEMMMKTLPSDAWQRCSGRVHISITRASLTGGLENVIVSQFSSNADLIAACLASSTIPLLSTSSLVSRFRGWTVLDGGLTNNLPTFDNRERPERRQLLFDMRKVDYPFALTLSASDFCIESLILRGAVEFRLFLLGLATSHRPRKGSKGKAKARKTTATTTEEKEASSSFSLGEGGSVISWGSTDGRERYGFVDVASRVAKATCLCAVGAWVARRYAPALLNATHRIAKKHTAALAPALIFGGTSSGSSLLLGSPSIIRPSSWRAVAH